jgi:GMP synthase PP-ATPase subunit
MKDHIINIIKILGVGRQEIIINMVIGKILIDTIELRDYDTIKIHHFEGDLDIEIDFDVIEPIYQTEIYHTLNSLLYN